LAPWDVIIQGVPESARGQSPRHIAFTITNITSAKFRDPAQTYTARDSPQALRQLSTSRTTWMVTLGLWWGYNRLGQN